MKYYIDNIELEEFYKRFYNDKYHVTYELALSRIKDGIDPKNAIKKELIAKKINSKPQEKKTKAYKDRKKSEYVEEIILYLKKNQVRINNLKNILDFVRSEIDNDE
ncbi:MAG: hypothetical protein BWY78_00070 [Alphaproteobacteria bacterium ADurb.Bin438]|nr:MAG: hypothetical protein BWY78_00070 [Alphaproteobacteria bacterium ADurb.Bin438]